MAMTAFESIESLDFFSSLYVRFSYIYYCSLIRPGRGGEGIESMAASYTSLAWFLRQGRPPTQGKQESMRQKLANIYEENLHFVSPL